MHAKEVAAQCVEESGAKRFGRDKALEVALIGLSLIPEGSIGIRTYRKRIRHAYEEAHPECGSVFMVFVLPLIISIVSQWIAKWIINRQDGGTIRNQARQLLSESRPTSTATPTSISTPRN